MTLSLGDAAAPNCWKCRYFSITHAPNFPYACQAMGFKSKQLPCYDVIRVDGRPCRHYVAKPEVAQT